MNTIVTLAMEADAQRWFDAQREAWFPPALNQIPAHLTLFHSLPGDAAIWHVLAEAAAAQAPFTMQVDGVGSMGRGVLYTLTSPDLQALHLRLAGCFKPFLTSQDKQRLRPHVVVQNKVEPAEAKALLAQLEAGFSPRTIAATGLMWWEYLGGPWRLIEFFGFC